MLGAAIIGSSVKISGKLAPGISPHGKENFLATLRCAGYGHGYCSAPLVESGAHATAASALLVGGLQERMG